MTGAASGLGTAVARLLIKEGGSVVLADVNRDTGEALTRQLGAAAHFVVCDVTSETDGKASIMVSGL